MRIGLIDLAELDYSPHTPLERPLGGMQSGISYLAVALVNRGHEVTLINRTSAPGVYSGVNSLHIDDVRRSGQLQQFDVVVSIYCDGLALRRAGKEICVLEGLDAESVIFGNVAILIEITHLTDSDLGRVPSERGLGYPHAVQDNREPSCDGYKGAHAPRSRHDWHCQTKVIAG